MKPFTRDYMSTRESVAGMSGDVVWYLMETLDVLEEGTKILYAEDIRTFLADKLYSEMWPGRSKYDDKEVK